jgi:uncharacterized damage-inducible protein DinB
MRTPDAAALLGVLDPARLEEIVTVPWFPSPHPAVRLLDTMHQVVLHSQGHRAQNALRLRQLGGAAPLTDYIVWILAGRPTPLWTAAPEAPAASP